MRKHLFHIFVLILISVCASCYAATDVFDDTNIVIAKRHLAMHSCLTSDEIDHLLTEVSINKRGETTVRFFYSKISDRFFEVSFFAGSGTVFSCNCEDTSRSHWENHVQYCNEMVPIFSASAEWENLYGSYLFWPPELKAAFFYKYGHIPYESEMQFLMGHRLYDYPDVSCVSLDEAQEKCRHILSSYFNETEKTISNFTVSAVFGRFEEKAIWSIDFYSSPEANNMPLLHYSFDLSAFDGKVMDGICINHEHNASHSLCYYTDIYEIEFFDDGAYYINRNHN